MSTLILIVLLAGAALVISAHTDGDAPSPTTSVPADTPPRSSP